jgi:PAS domain S-box-containing protein
MAVHGGTAGDRALRSLGDVVGALHELPVPLFAVDGQGVIRWLNPAAEELLGPKVGRRYTSIVAAESEPVVREAFARKILGQATSTEYNALMRRHDGRSVEAEISSVALTDAGTIAGVFGAITPAPRPHVSPAGGELTPRQAQTLRLLAHGHSTAQMAAELNLSRDTVRNHIRDLLRRLGVHSRLEAVVVARERGLI